MKSIKLTAVGEFKLFDEPVPQISENEVLVAVKSVGICRSDIHYYNQGRIGSDHCKFPQGLGHECAGIIAQSKSKKFTEGTRVAVEPARPCMLCEHCKTAHYNRCPNVRFLGSPGMPAALQEFIVVHETQVASIPESIDFDDAALLEPLGVAYHACMLSLMKPADSVAIFGAGPIGLCTLAMVKACGAAETFIFDTLEYRLDYAKKVFGASHCVNVCQTNPTEFIKERTLGRGVDICFEAVGVEQTFTWSFDNARIGGKVLLIGIPEQDSFTFNPHPWRRKELLIQNVRRSNMALEPCISLMERNVVALDGMATHHVDLEHTAEAFALVEKYADNVIKAIVTL